MIFVFRRGTAFLHILTAGATIYQYDVDGFLTDKPDGPDITQYDYSTRSKLLSVNLPDGRIIVRVALKLFILAISPLRSGVKS